MSSGTGTVTVERQSPACGAVVHGVDLAPGVSDELLGVLRDALLEHLMVCVRDQGHLTPDEQIAFAARWGRIEPHPYVDPIDGHPEIIEVYDPNPITQTWHADFTYAKQPPAQSFLLARTIPPVGGDTMFANCYLAYEGLSTGMQDTLGSLKAVHYATQLAIDKGMPEDEIVNAHPVVRTHPETGRKLLFVNGDYTRHFEGWTEAESAPLLAYLYGQVGRPEHSYRHRWQEGDLLIWDNRAAQHAVVGDTAGQPRSLHRVTVASGEAPR
jgi:taurine dioxygenase